mmetsp:Transcript_99554/g.277119  ORF Transcript_99554/g.277119 Transcript_99554/m.277119 type:complete len:476 (-) Transcript_99554:122-1549(-)
MLLAPVRPYLVQRVHVNGLLVLALLAHIGVSALRVDLIPPKDLAEPPKSRGGTRFGTFMMALAASSALAAVIGAGLKLAVILGVHQQNSTEKSKHHCSGHSPFLAVKPKNWFCNHAGFLLAAICIVLVLVGCLGGLIAYAGAEHVSCAVIATLRMEFSNATTKCSDGGLRDAQLLVSSPSVLNDAHVLTLPGGVPKIIHQISLCSPVALECSPTRSRQLPAQTLEWMRTWSTQHPGWLHVLWTDGDVRALLSEQGAEAVELFESYPHAVMRADMARAYILWAHGGVYADEDYEALRPIDPYIQRHGLCLVESPYKKWEDVQNSLMASRPRHPFWREVISRMQARKPKLTQFGVDVMKMTGPQLLSEALKAYEHSHKHDGEDDVDSLCRLGPADQFMFGQVGDDGQPGVALHHYAHSWDAENTRDDVRRAGAYIFVASAMLGMAAWRCYRSPTKGTTQKRLLLPSSQRWWSGAASM